ncbi:PGN_0703 family putative restriction endonuclease [Microvirga flavescens]|uniref:PGN_0703 family putative restriction endonuclease n=1 Tax=Microvirga flavescens TaxID=2249811 RepID=UPI0013009055|nr:hypothetical protein [Microvirga flavescens]
MPDFENPILRLPIIPADILKRHKVLEEYDTRFRASARLLQALWRQDQDLPIGSYATQSGERRKLGSRITTSAGRSGANFLHPDIANLVRHQVAYREVGALIDEQRLYMNLLSSMPLTFNLFGPMALDLELATRTLHAICPDLSSATVTEVLFEHSPGRGNPNLTGDYTAFDVLLAYEGQSGRRGFIAVEVKYSEAMTEPSRPIKPRYDELSAVSKFFIDPESPALRTNPLQQLFRSHLLAYAMLTRGDYDEGRFIVIAPSLNHQVQTAIGTYRCQLLEAAESPLSFGAVTLERVIECLNHAGEPEHAAVLHKRYCDWHRVDQEVKSELVAQSRLWQRPTALRRKRKQAVSEARAS